LTMNFPYSDSITTKLFMLIDKDPTVQCGIAGLAPISAKQALQVESLISRPALGPQP
jgi:hypothetical protein